MNRNMNRQDTERAIVRTYWFGGYWYKVTTDVLGTERHTVIGKHKKTY